MRRIVISLAVLASIAGLAYLGLNHSPVSPATDRPAASIAEAARPASASPEKGANKPNPAPAQENHPAVAVGATATAKLTANQPPLSTTVHSNVSNAQPPSSHDLPANSTRISRPGSALAIADRFGEFEKLTLEQRARLRTFLTTPDPDRGLTEDVNKATTDAEKIAALHAHLDPAKARLIEAVGEDVARDYQSYVVSQAIVPLTEDTSSRCIAAGLPVAPDLAERLAFALASSIEVSAAGLPTAMRGRVPISDQTRTRLLDERGAVMTIVHQFLTPDQTRIFQESLSARLNRKQ